MSVFKKVKTLSEIRKGEKYIDLSRHRIWVCDEIHAFGNMVIFHDLEDDDDTIILQWSEIKDNLRKFNLSNIELRALLCQSMIDFLLLMMSQDIEE